MENEVAAGWQLGMASAIAGFWVLLWFLGRPLLKLMQVIGRFFKRIAGYIQRFLQPIFEFLYRSFYTILQAITAIGLGYVALMPVIGTDDFGMPVHAESGVAALVMVAMTVIVFRHFLKFPLRKGQSSGTARALSEADTDDLDTDADMDFDLDL